MSDPTPDTADEQPPEDLIRRLVRQARADSSEPLDPRRIFGHHWPDDDTDAA